MGKPHFYKRPLLRNVLANRRVRKGERTCHIIIHHHTSYIVIHQLRNKESSDLHLCNHNLSPLQFHYSIMEGFRNYDYPQQAAPRSEHEGKGFEPPESKNCNIYEDPTIVRIDARGEISLEQGMFVLVPKYPNVMQVEWFDASSQVVWDEFGVEAEYGYFCPLRQRANLEGEEEQDQIVLTGELVKRKRKTDDEGSVVWEPIGTSTRTCTAGIPISPKYVTIKMINSSRQHDVSSIERFHREISAMQHVERYLQEEEEDIDIEKHERERPVEEHFTGQQVWEEKMRVIREHHVILPLDVLCDEETNMLIVVTPFCDGGELLELLDHERFEEEKVKVLFKQLLKGLATLQNARIFHQNITISNIKTVGNEVAILFNFEHTMMIPYSADDRRCLIPYPRRFGEVSSISKTVSFSTFSLQNIFSYFCIGINAQLHYHAPELTNRSIVCDGPAVDLWAMGVILYIMVFFEKPWEHTLHTNRMGAFFDDGFFPAIVRASIERNDRMQRISTDLVDLLQCLFLESPRQRLCLNQVLQHAWIAHD